MPENLFERTKRRIAAETGLSGDALEAATFDYAADQCEAELLAGRAFADVAAYTYRRMAQIKRGEIAC